MAGILIEGSKVSGLDIYIRSKNGSALRGMRWSYRVCRTRVGGYTTVNHHEFRYGQRLEKKRKSTTEAAIHVGAA